jgi:IclR family transcriptional regulator, KDG regulon repressor
MVEGKLSGISQLNYIMEILSMFESCEGELSVTEIAAKTQLSKGAVSRNLHAMEVWDLVEQNPETRKFQLGMKLFRLGSAVNRVKLLRVRAHPIMDQLARVSGKTVGLMVRQDDYAISIHQVNHSQWTPLALSIGRTFQFYAGSSPKLLLAFSPLNVQEQYLNQHQNQPTPSFDIEKLREELLKIRQLGYAVSGSEVDPGITSVSVPVWGTGDEPVAALGILWPESGITEDLIAQIAGQGKSASQEITKTLGYPVR